MKIQYLFIIIGLVGTFVSLAVNLLGIFVFHKAAAEFFSAQWWSEWFPSYIVWMVFIISGLGMPPRSKPRA